MNKKNSQKGSALIIIITAVVVLVVGGLVYVAWNNSFRAEDKPTQQTETSQGTQTEEIPTVTTTLPNGKTAVYPGIKTNKNIVFLAQTEFDNPEYVKITHVAYKKFLDYLGGNVDDLCGPDDNLKAVKKDIIFGLLNTTDKTITYPQNGNCVEYIASDENSDTRFKREAQQVLDQVKSDVNSFVKSVTIQ